MGIHSIGIWQLPFINLKSLCRKTKLSIQILQNSYETTIQRDLQRVAVVSGVTDEPENLTSYFRREAKTGCMSAPWLWG
jgi:hypothetical protein